MGIIFYCVTFHPCLTLFIMNNEQSPIYHNHLWAGGGPCLVNAVARRLNGGGSWVGELLGVADVIKG